MATTKEIRKFLEEPNETINIYICPECGSQEDNDRIIVSFCERCDEERELVYSRQSRAQVTPVKRMEIS